jgi:hypothetical protein
LLGVTNGFFGVSHHLLLQALGLHFFVVQGLPGSLLGLAGEVFHAAFDLFFVHGVSPKK